jgi:hypothetical protein
MEPVGDFSHRLVLRKFFSTKRTAYTYQRCCSLLELQPRTAAKNLPEAGNPPGVANCGSGKLIVVDCGARLMSATIRSGSS